MEPYAGTLMTKWYRRRGYVSLMRSLWHTWRRMILSRRIYASTFGKDQRLCSSSGRPFSQTSFRRSGTLPNNNQESSVNSGRPIHKLELCRRSGTLPHENRESSVNSGRPSHVLEKSTLSTWSLIRQGFGWRRLPRPPWSSEPDINEGLSGTSASWESVPWMLIETLLGVNVKL